MTITDIKVNLFFVLSDSISKFVCRMFLFEDVVVVIGDYAYVPHLLSAPSFVYLFLFVQLILSH